MKPAFVDSAFQRGGPTTSVYFSAPNFQRKSSVSKFFIHFVNSMLAIYQEQGKLPVWHLMGNETNTMVGYHAVPVIVDAYLKGFDGFDAELAFEAVKAFAMRDERGLDFIKEIEYIPAEAIVKGGSLKFVMGPGPNRAFGAAQSARPSSAF